jgi:hypothetical protein
MTYSRFIPPPIGDSVRIRPLIDGPSIQIIGKYYCLPVFNYASQKVEVYIVAQLGELTSSYNLIGKLYSSITDEKFSEHDVVVETVGAQIGNPYIHGIVRVVTIRTPFTKQVQLPTSDECQQLIAQYMKVRKAFLQRKKGE